MNTAFPFAFPLSQKDIQSSRAIILSRMLTADEGFCQIPVASIHSSSLRFLLLEYDRLFFSGFLLSQYDDIRVTLSSRLTSAAGKFIYARNPSTRLNNAEIRMSSDFLFRLNKGPFQLNGLTASSPQEAFLIVFEHELCHALETALYGKTGHSKRFLTLSNGIFGHTDTCHSLPTRKGEAQSNGLMVGSYVHFPYKGKQISGLVTYIGKTATVMVPNLLGEYRDKNGKRYTKYRVPLNLLQKNHK